MTEPAFVKWARSLSTTKYVQVTREVLNLVTGAILNNYQIVMDHSDDKEEKQETK